MEPSKQPHRPPQPLSQSDLYGLMLECMVEGVCCLDTQGNITFLNRSAARMLAVDPIEMIGRRMSRSSRLPRTGGVR